MNTIFWLAVAFGVFSGLLLCVQAHAYSKLTEFEKLYSKPHFWPYPVFLACVVIALTV